MSFLKEIFSSAHNALAIAGDNVKNVVGLKTSTEHRIYKALRKLGRCPIPCDAALFQERKAAFLANLAEKGWPVYNPRPGRLISVFQRLDIATSILALVDASSKDEADLRFTYNKLKADNLSSPSFKFIVDHIIDIEAAAAGLDQADPEMTDIFKLLFLNLSFIHY